MFKGIIVSSLLLLVVVLIVRTLHLSQQPPQTSQCTPADADFIALTEERLQHFQSALTYETVSREEGDYNTEDLFKFGEFIIATFPHIHRHSPLVTWERVNNYSLLYHVKGSDPSLRPYLLMAHTDVVPVTNLDQWHAPPFSGEVKDGFIYGRGTIDDKNNVMGILEATEFMLANKIVPKRSFYIALGHDEEVRGSHGAAFISKRLQEKGVTEMEFIVDEGMAVFEGIIDGVSCPVASVGVSEKGQAMVKLSVEMAPGHSSMPPKETPITVLARAIQRLNDNPQPSMLGHGVETDMFESMVPKMALLQRVVISNMWLFRYPLSWLLSQKPTTNAVIRTVTAVTFFNSGIKFNIIPPSAEAIINHRIHPSQSVQQVVDYDRAVIADPRVKMEVVSFMEPHPVAGHKDGDLGYQVLRTSINQVWPEALVIPAIMVGNTDTIHYLNFTRNVYRFSPTHMFPGDPERFHGINERMAVKNYEQVINWFYHLMRNADQVGASLPHTAHSDL